MKNRNILRISIMFVVISFLLSGCTFDEERNYKVSDTSDTSYYVEHFSKDCKTGYQHSVHNGKDIIYIDGTTLYRYSDGKNIIDNVQIEKMVYTDTHLFVLEDSDNLHIINMDSLKDYEIAGIDGLEYDGANIYLSQCDNKDIYYVDENEMLIDDEFIGFDKMAIFDDKNTLCNLYCDDFYYWVIYDKGPIYSGRKDEVSVTRNTEDMKNKKSILLDDAYIISENNLSIDGDNAYILYQVRDEKKKFSGIQGEIYCDGILSLDFDNEKSEEVYETESNLTRIVGFDSDNNIVYLYDVNSYRIYALDLGTNQQTTIGTLEKKYNSLVFEMSKDVLFIYTDNNELVQIVELKK